MKFSINNFYHGKSLGVLIVYPNLCTQEAINELKQTLGCCLLSVQLTYLFMIRIRNDQGLLIEVHSADFGSSSAFIPCALPAGHPVPSTTLILSLHTPRHALRDSASA